MSAVYSIPKKNFIKSRYGRLEKHVLDHIEGNQDKCLLAQTKFNSLMDKLIWDDFFFQHIISYWYDNNSTLPKTLTEATEIAMKNHVQMYCKVKPNEIDNMWKTVQERLYEVGKHEYYNIPQTPVFQLHAVKKGLINKTDLFSLVKVYQNKYVFPSQYVYFYSLALYISKTPNVLLQQKTFMVFLNTMPAVMYYVSSMLRDRASFFFDLLPYCLCRSLLSRAQQLAVLGGCLHESCCPDNYTKTTEDLYKQPPSDKLSPFDIKCMSLHSFQPLSFIKKNNCYIHEVMPITDHEKLHGQDEFYRYLNSYIESPSGSMICNLSNPVGLAAIAKMLHSLFLVEKCENQYTSFKLTYLSIDYGGFTSDKQIGKRTARLLMQALGTQQLLKKLYLTYFEEDFIIMLIQSLVEQNVTLKVEMLSLRRNGLDRSFAHHIVKCIKCFPYLRTLDLRNNDLGTLGCMALMPLVDKVKVLVENNGIEDSVSLRLLKCEQIINQIGDISMTVPLIETLSEFVDLRNKCLQVSHFNVSELPQALLNDLSNSVALFGNLSVLNLSHCNIQEGTAVTWLQDSLPYFSELHHLDLSHNKLDCKTVVKLVEHCPGEIRFLNLSHNMLSSSIDHLITLAKILSSRKNLQYVDVSGNDLAGVGIQTLLHQIEDSSLQHKVDISNNMSGLKTVLRCIRSQIPQHVSVPELDKYKLMLNEVKDIVHYLANLESVCFSSLSASESDDICRNLKIMRNLEKLVFERCQIKTLGDCFDYLVKLKHLDLSMSCSKQLQPVVFNKLSTLSKLENLNVSFNNIQHHISSLLENIPISLHGIVLHYCNLGPVEVSKIIAHLPSMPHIEYINISFNDINIENLQTLLNSSEDVLSKIKCNLPCTMEFLSILDHQIPSQLNYEANSLCDIQKSGVLDHILTMKKLQLSNLTEKQSRTVCKDLRTLASLERLSLTQCTISKDSIKTLFLHKSVLANLKYLNLSENKLEFAFKTIAENLSHCNNLKQLDLSNNQSGGHLEDIMKALPSSLTHLNLSGNNFESEAVKNALFTLPAIFVNFGSNKIEPNDIWELLELTGSPKVKCSFNVFTFPGLSLIDSPRDAQRSRGYSSEALPTLLDATPLDVEAVRKRFETLLELTKLDLHSSDFTERDILLICKDIGMLTYLEELNLSHCGMNEDAARELAHSFETLKHLKKIDISSNDIGDAGMRHMIDSIHFPKEFEQANFSATKLGINSIVYLLDKLSNDAVSVAKGINVAHNLSSIAYLIPFITDRLDINIPAQDIDFDGNDLSLHDLQFIKDVSQVESIILEDQQWNHTSMLKFSRGLSNLINLKNIVLRGNNIGNAVLQTFCEEVKDVQFLEEIDLSENNLSEIGASSFGQLLNGMTNIRRLNFSKNAIGADGVQRLCSGLTNKKLLLSLNFSYCKIGDSGAKHLCKLLESSNWLKHLNLSGNLISDTGARRIGEAIGQTPTLEYLNLSHNEIGDNSVICISEGMKTCQKLQHLDLSHNNITDSGSHQISTSVMNMKELKHLVLSHNKIRKDGAVSLSTAFKHLKSLIYFDLSHNYLGEFDAGMLFRAISTWKLLTHLYLGHNGIWKMNLEGFETKESTEQLKHLDLCSNEIGPNGALELSKVMVHMKQLTYFDISQNKIGDKGAETLSKVMEGWEKLRHLNLSDNNITSSGLRKLNNAIKVMRFLEYLDLSNNSLGDTGLIGFRLQDMTSLRYLYLNNIGISHVGLKIMIKGVKYIDEISHIHLSRNQIGDTGANILSECFGHLNHLRLINLAHNTIGNAGIQSLSKAFKRKNLAELEHLDLSHNKIGDLGAENLKDSLKYLRNLQFIDFTNNPSIKLPAYLDEIDYKLDDSELETVTEGDHWEHVRQFVTALEDSISSSLQTQRFSEGNTSSVMQTRKSKQDSGSCSDISHSSWLHGL